MIEPWIQDLVGIPYIDGGDSPDTGFYCTGLARYIYEQKFQKTLPIDPLKWRAMFEDVGWPVELKPYDLIVMNDGESDTHIAIACDDREIIHATALCKSVVIEPVSRYSYGIRSVFRLK